LHVCYIFAYVKSYYGNPHEIFVNRSSWPKESSILLCANDSNGSDSGSISLYFV